MSPPAEAQPTDQHERDGEGAAKNKTEFQFLTFTDYNQTTNRETKRKVRSHVMHRLQKDIRNEKRKENGKVIVLDTSSLFQTPAGSKVQSFASPVNAISISMGMGHPSDLGAGRSNPFIKYPVKMDIRTRELVDHMHGDSCPNFKTMNRLGFFQAVVDEAAFRQLLCTASSHMSTLQNGTVSPEAISLTSQAIKSVNRRLADPVLSLSNGIMVAIMAFACHAIMFNDVRGALTHFNGLEEMIRRRRGVLAINFSPPIRMILFWLDINTAFLQGRAPRFPDPNDILPPVDAAPSTPVASKMLLKACIADEMIDAVRFLSATNALMARELASRDLWDDGLFAHFNVIPALSKFLSVLPKDILPDLGSSREEACRIGAILYLAGVRRKFGLPLATDVFILKLKTAITQWDLSDIEHHDRLLLWVFLIGGAQSILHEEHQWYVLKLADAISLMGYSCWETVMATAHEVLWVQGIFDSECEKLHKEVSTTWLSLHGHVFY